METKLIEKVSEVILAIKSVKHVVEVVCALHSLALHLFPLDSSLLSGSVDQRYREQVCSNLSLVPRSLQKKRGGSGGKCSIKEWLHEGISSFGKTGIWDSRPVGYLASYWLACFPFSARIHVYDVFFVDGLATEVVQTLVPCLQQNAIDDHDVNSVYSNTESSTSTCVASFDPFANRKSWSFQEPDIN
uniref:Uncharacterized protein n=1 Tax=Quercus lobata TaxID=97700 RepID=A0A7N2MMW4_QUELO